MCVRQFPIRASVTMFEDNIGNEASAAWIALVCPLFVVNV